MGIDSAVIAFMREERDFMAAKMKEQKEELERQRKEMEAKLSPAVAISGEQLIRVQARLEKLHAAKLLTDDELFVMEVRTADSARETHAIRLECHAIIQCEACTDLVAVDRICAQM